MQPSNSGRYTAIYIPDDPKRAIRLRREQSEYTKLYVQNGRRGLKKDGIPVPSFSVRWAGYNDTMAGIYHGRVKNTTTAIIVDHESFHDHELHLLLGDTQELPNTMCNRIKCMNAGIVVRESVGFPLRKEGTGLHRHFDEPEINHVAEETVGFFGRIGRALGLVA